VEIAVAVADVAPRTGHVRFPQIDDAAVIAPQPDFLDAPLFHPAFDADPPQDGVVIGHGGAVARFRIGGQRLQNFDAIDDAVAQAGPRRGIFVAVIGAARAPGRRSPLPSCAPHGRGSVPAVRRHPR
jgi:hypothetical protein